MFTVLVAKETKSTLLETIKELNFQFEMIKKKSNHQPSSKPLTEHGLCAGVHEVILNIYFSM